MAVLLITEVAVLRMVLCGRFTVNRVAVLRVTQGGFFSYGRVWQYYI